MSRFGSVYAGLEDQWTNQRTGVGVVVDNRLVGDREIDSPLELIDAQRVVNVRTQFAVSDL
jgi:hypothetical protein